MDKQTKARGLLALGTALVVLLLLAASLPQLRLDAGRSFSLADTVPEATGDAMTWDWGQTLLLVVRGILALGVLLYLVYVLVSLFTPEGRARLLIDLIVLLVLTGLLSLLRPLAEPAVPAESEVAGGGPLPTPPPAGPTATFSSQVPLWAELLIVVALAALIAAIVAAVMWWWMKRRRAGRAGALERLAQQTQGTLDALRAGEPLQDAVMRSYRQMSLFLQEERGIHRERSLTPSEFEQQLTQAGFPPQPVHGLTSLFEMVRYGRRVPGPAEEELAVGSLQEIVDFCQAQESRP